MTTGLSIVFVMILFVTLQSRKTATANPVASLKSE